nr:acyltransferase [uncultured Neokomagataea sp.]
MAADHLVSFENTKERYSGPDLVRAVAIIEVLVCHDAGMVAAWCHKAFPFHLAVLGFYGVMLFFVLSGFLVGRIILELLEQKATWRDWGIFITRRWLRTLPAYYFWLLGLLVPLAYFGPYGVPWDEAKRTLPYYLTLTQNFDWPMVSGWYGVSWSLCVEEWFYVVFPGLALLLLVCRVRPAVVFGVVLATFFIAPLCWRLSLPVNVNWDEVTSKVVPCRLDSIAWGVAAAWFYKRFNLKTTSYAFMAVCGTVIVLVVWWADELPFPLWSARFQSMASYDVVGLAYALCMPAMMCLRALPSLIGRVVRNISTYSYGLYLCHLPLVLMAGDLQVRYGIRVRYALIFTIITTLGGAFFSWRLIERPCLKLRMRQSFSKADF